MMSTNWDLLIENHFNKKGNEEGKVTIVQSSIKKGYRINTGTWEGSAGLKGFSVGVLTLPA